MDKWQEIFTALRQAGIDTYAPGGHIGVCTAPYCVVQHAGASLQGGGRGASADYRVYLVVPAEKPAALMQLAERVRSALSPMAASGALTLSVPLSQTLTDDMFSALISHIDYTCCYSERN